MKSFTKTLTLLFIVLSTVSCKKKREFKNEQEFKDWLKGKTFISIGKDHPKKDADGNMTIPTGQIYFHFDDRGIMAFKDDYHTNTYEVYLREGGYAIDFNKYGIEYEFLVTDKVCQILSEAYNTNNNGSRDMYIGPDMEEDKK